MPRPKQNLFEKWGAREIEPGVFCSSFCPPNGELISKPFNAPEVKTSWDAFQRGLALSPKGNCLGWRNGNGYDWWTYQDVTERVRQLCLALKTKTPLTKQQFVGIYAACLPQWAICALAINARSLCIVPLYDTLGTDSRNHIINEVEMSVLFVDTWTAVNTILDCAYETPSLKTIICFQNGLDFDAVKKANVNSITVMTLTDFVSSSGKQDDAFDIPNADDIAVVQYTSGTTGYPKGVVIPHQAFMANVVGVDYPFAIGIDPAVTIDEKSVCLLFLPLAHMYAQLICSWYFFHGASIGFYGGNVVKIVEDASILKPTFIPMVPRIMNRVYTKIKAQIGDTGFKAKLFWFCYRQKRKLMLKGKFGNKTIYDKIAFRKIQQLLGGRLRLISVGSAPISADVLEFWRVCTGCVIGEGYGQSESSVIATMAIGPAGGNVGPPLVCNYIKLVDAEECGYFVKDGKGEVCVKGPNVMRGYYKQPDKTAEAIDADGWLHTGDIGDFLPDGSLRIFDRKKHMFKLAQGEYISPEKIENIYAMSPLVSQVFVDGSSLESFTVAVVVPDSLMAKEWAKSKNADHVTLTTNPDFVKYVLQELLKAGKENKLNSLEQVRSIYLTAEPFSTANGLLTPSMKNKRPQLRRFFKVQIDAMYRKGPILAEAVRENGKATANGKAKKGNPGDI